VELEQVQLTAEPAMVAAARLLQPLQVLVQRLPGEERGAVDALQHLAARVAAPVGARGVEQLEEFQPPGARHVRAAAEVQERAVAEDGDRLVGRELVEPLQLQRVVGEQFASLVGGYHAALERLVLARDVGHLALDPLQLLRRERVVDLEVVVEPVVDGGAEPDLRLGAYATDGRGQHVRGRVAQHRRANPASRSVSSSSRASRSIGRVTSTTSPFTRAAERRPRQPRADPLRDLQGCRARRRRLAHGAVGERDPDGGGGRVRHGRVGRGRFDGAQRDVCARSRIHGSATAQASRAPARAATSRRPCRALDDPGCGLAPRASVRDCPMAGSERHR
jgi:hypothetical protein